MRILTGLAASLALLGLVACNPAGEAEAPASEAPATEAATTEAAATPAATPGDLEVGFDRPSGDYRSVHEVADAEACRTLCEDDEACRAFTWVQAGVQAEAPVCWLKDQVPGTVEAEWATSGVMVGRDAPAEG